MRMLEGALRNLQNSRDPPSLTRAEIIQELKKNLKEEAAKIGPVGPKLTDKDIIDTKKKRSAPHNSSKKIAQSTRT